MAKREETTVRPLVFPASAPGVGAGTHTSSTVLRTATQRLEAILDATEQDGEGLAPPASARVRQDVSRPLRWLPAVDALALIVGFIGSWALAFALHSFVFEENRFHPEILQGGLRLAQFLGIAAGVLLWFEHTGHRRIRMPFWIEVKSVAMAMAAALVVDGFLQFASRQDLSRLWLASSWIFAGFALVLLRGLWRRAMRRRGLWQARTLLVGNGAVAEEASAALASEPGLGYEIVARIADLPRAFHEAGRTWEGLCARHGADYVVIALDGGDLARSGQPLAQLMRENIPFSVSPPMQHLPALGMVPHYFFNHDVVLLTRHCGLEQPLPRLIKRAFDILASGTAILLLSPVFLILALLVKLDGGPAFFPNKRLGLDGKIFGCLKFRSMVLDSDRVLEAWLRDADPAAREDWNVYKKIKGEDPRVTRVGRFLRRTSLDELPQLINVLTGDMSLVGPRPILLRELDEYNNDIAHYYRVRPGITGLWQVSGRNEVSYAQRVQMDSWYVRNWSLWHDIVILFKTFPVLLKRKGAY